MSTQSHGSLPSTCRFAAHSTYRRRTSAAALLASAIAASLSGSAEEFTVNVYPLPVQYSGPGGITVGPDGNLWFTEVFNN